MTRYAPTLTVLAYVVRDTEVLLCHRIARTDDEQHGKWNGLGGKMERFESPLEAVRREVREEAGLELTEVTLRGTLNWPGFGRDGADVFGFVFLVTGFTGEPPASNVEGTLAWQPLDALAELPMWAGDRHFLPLVFDADLRPFHALIPYADGVPTGFSVSR